MSIYQNLPLNNCVILHNDGLNLLDVSFFDVIKTEAILSPGKFCIKFVSLGEEIYHLSQKTYGVKEKEYLLANDQFRGRLEINKPTKGICIDIDIRLVKQVLSYLTDDKYQEDVKALEDYFCTSNFLYNKYAAEATQLGQYLIDLDKKFQEYNLDQIFISTDFYFTIAEKLIEDNLPIYKKIQTIDAVKISTKNDLYKKIQSAKLYIDEHFKDDIVMEKVARECCISEYHFFRMFKKIMDISPYQYLLQNRLKYAESQIQVDKMNITEIALDAGFSDVFSFSKSFKKTYGVSPRAYYKLYFKL